MDNLQSRIKDGQLEFVFDTRVYPLDVVYAGCYRFIDDFYIFLTPGSDHQITAIWEFKDKSLSSDQALLAHQGEFFNELLNVAFRKEIVKNNRNLREMLVSQALFAANPEEMDKLVIGLDENNSADDFVDDPDEITKSWEEKYGAGSPDKV